MGDRLDIGHLRFWLRGTLYALWQENEGVPWGKEGPYKIGVTCGGDRNVSDVPDELAKFMIAAYQAGKDDKAEEIRKAMGVDHG